MDGKYKPGQRVYLSGSAIHLVREATIVKYAGGFLRPLLRTAVVQE